MDPAIFGNWTGYLIGALFASFLALAAVFWVFFDSGRRGVDAIPWKVIAVLSLILVIPWVVLALWPPLRTDLARALTPLTWLGIAGGVAALITLIGYSLGLGVGSHGHDCPTCGRKLDPSWDYCPDCGPPTRTEVVPEPFPLPPPPPLEETFVVPEPEFVDPVPVPDVHSADKTMLMFTGPPRLAWLIQLSGARVGKDFRLGEVTNIGRDASQNDLVIDEPRVGRQHARIRLDDEEFVLHDLASINRTFINDEEILKQVLKDGDRVRFADAEFYFMEIVEPEI